MWLHRELIVVLSVHLLGIAQSWIPYTATYRESSTFKDVNGSENVKTKVITETRSADGSVLKVVKSGGQVISKTLWLGCGDMISFNLANKTANIGGHHARVHGTPPKDKPIGNAVIADVRATAWPIHLPDGTGTAWIDAADDIFLKTEINTRNTHGQYTYNKEVTKLDLSSPVNDEDMKVPKDFKLMGINSTSACSTTAVTK